MKRKTLGIWVMVALGTLIMGLGNAQQLLTPDQAKDAVRTFENDSGMVFSACALRELTTGPTWTQTKWYDVLQPGSGDYDRLWRVQAYTGEVLLVFYGDRMPANDSDQPVGPRTQQECLVIAENYARSKYTGFDSMGFVINAQEWKMSGWRFTWGQVVQYGARTFNVLVVDVNPIDGLVQKYVATRYSVIAPSQPQITIQQAIDRAMQEAFLVTQTTLRGPVLWTDPTGAVVYSTVIGGEDTLGESHDWTVTVSAIDGSLVVKQMAGGDMSSARYENYLKQLEARKKALDARSKGVGSTAAKASAGKVKSAGASGTGKAK